MIATAVSQSLFAAVRDTWRAPLGLAGQLLRVYNREQP
jgi:hypothetical protein